MAFTKVLGPGIGDGNQVIVGIITATAFYGDGSNLDGITSAGLGTAVESGSLYGGEQIYYTNTVLGIGGTVTVDPPSSTNVAYTQYVDIAVDEDADLIIGDGDDLVLDILGIGTEGVGLLPGNGGRVRADNFTNKAGTGAPKFNYGVQIPIGYGLTGAGGINITGIATVNTINVGTGVTIKTNGSIFTGVVTATSFSGNLTGNATSATTSINAQGLTGTPSISVSALTASSATINGNTTINGSLTVDGTTTSIDTVNLVIEDKNIGIGTTSSASNTTADGAGFTIFGGAGGDKTLTWERGSSSFVYSDPNKFKGVLETVSAATTYNSGNNLVLELDVRNATTYTYTIPTGANIGIVSFKNMPAFTGNANGTTITCIFTQMSTTPAGTGNTTGTTGIGTNCTVIGYENGSAVAGISTRALVGSATTITLSATSNDRDFVSFFVHYTGGTNTTATSYQVYATKNGGFRQGNVGV